VDGLHPPLHAPEIGRSGQGQEPAADHDPGRRDQPGPDQDGRVLPRHDLRQARLAASLAYPRRNLFGAALAELVNAQFRHPFAEHWGDGTTSSSDGQNFRTGSKAESTGHINPKYGSSPGRTFYTHISDQYAPFHTKVVNVGVRDSTYVLDGLLYHESDLRIEEHYTDTAGFTDHVFA
jgi:hypothetical protein